MHILPFSLTLRLTTQLLKSLLLTEFMAKTFFESFLKFSLWISGKGHLKIHYSCTVIGVKHQMLLIVGLIPFPRWQGGFRVRLFTGISKIKLINRKYFNLFLLLLIISLFHFFQNRSTTFLTCNFSSKVTNKIPIWSH